MGIYITSILAILAQYIIDNFKLSNKKKKASKLIALLISIAVICFQYNSDREKDKTAEKDKKDLIFKLDSVKIASILNQNELLKELDSVKNAYEFQKLTSNKILGINDSLLILSRNEQAQNEYLTQKVESLNNELKEGLLVTNSFLHSIKTSSGARIISPEAEKMFGLSTKGVKGKVSFVNAASTQESQSLILQLQKLLKHNGWLVDDFISSHNGFPQTYGIVLIVNNHENLPEGVNEMYSFLKTLEFDVKGAESKSVVKGSFVIKVGFLR